MAKLVRHLLFEDLFPAFDDKTNIVKSILQSAGIQKNDNRGELYVTV